ncbi:hypothetical protein B0H11DRAFT_1969267 [Mycena galericulata]|nr:hypothetical protein B0H11DRAFT_1969267 [Mycena galericulata]
MRRFASVFKKKDKDPRPNTVPPVLSPVPGLSSGSEPASSASSNGSASLSLSLQTPEDDPSLPGTPTKSKWATWLGKKSGTIKRGRPADDLWVSEWRPSEPPPILQAPPRPQRNPTDSDEEEDEDQDPSDDEDDRPQQTPRAHPVSPYVQSRKNIELFTRNSLVHRPDLSPFVQLPGAPMYPRSANSPRSLPVRLSMHAVMHKTLLLRRLHQSSLDDSSILPFATRPTPTPVDPPQSLPWHSTSIPAPELRFSTSSPGLRRWMSRPCFEERIAVWVPLNGALTTQPVAGSTFAVAELEYSAALDAMVGFGLPPVQEEDHAPAPVPTPSPPPPPPAPAPQPQPQPVAPAAAARTTSHITVPSPLRNSALKSPVAETPPDAAAPATQPPVLTTTSRVRFAEDDKEDVIPLGYALRAKKRREDKAKFLREEQERRAFEEERAKQEEERLRREQERMRWEEEKRAWEKEKRAMEEERKQRIYAEEVAAARIRREQQRAGGGYGASNTGVLPGVLAASSSTASLRDERNKLDSGRHSRPFHDQGGPRRQASEPAVPMHANTPSSSPLTSSPGSSRPPSVAGPQAGRNASRPPSPNPSSSASAGKRSSMASLPSKNGTSTFDRPSIYGMWSASNPTLLMPPVPPVPMYTMDMPLLPPTPPFMMQQYPRPRSQNSQHSSHGHSSPSASPSRQRNPSNGSSERVNVQHQQQASNSASSSRRGSHSSTHRPDAPQAPQQRADDARRVSLPPPKAATSSQALDRGRAQASVRSQASMRSHALGGHHFPGSCVSSMQPPSPWTAPPLTTSYSQQQLSPTAITSGYTSRPPPKPSRRQTTIS